MNNKYHRTATSEKGQSLVTYGLLLVLISVVSFVTLSLLGDTLKETYCQITSTFGGSCESYSDGNNDDGSEEFVDFTISNIKYANRRLHLDVQFEGGVNPDVTMTVSPPGREMVMKKDHYHIKYRLRKCPCSVTITSSTGGSKTIIVGP